MLLHVSVVYSFLLLGCIPLCVCVNSLSILLLKAIWVISSSGNSGTERVVSSVVMGQTCI